ncbi:hypothetical protein C1H46_034477 [Malus baccata]|uniref:Ubiquitin carboxyl-terminal hydrolase 7 ICP0-binding domain-containing protein n=1 Tax=Malus baccata TaxID=106549 RepID=A0A540L0G0_MALBA|nr:hypothetical protein C1H46_034477 [Malus baccata]
MGTSYAFRNLLHSEVKKNANIPLSLHFCILELKFYLSVYYQEIKFDPCITCEHIHKWTSFRLSQIDDEDIICFQKSTPLDSEIEYEYADVPSFLDYVHNRQGLCFVFQIDDEDIICFQKSTPLDSEIEYEYADVPSFLDYVHNRQIDTVRYLENLKAVDSSAVNQMRLRRTERTWLLWALAYFPITGLDPSDFQNKKKEKGSMEEGTCNMLGKAGKKEMGGAKQSRGSKRPFFVIVQVDLDNKRSQITNLDAKKALGLQDNGDRRQPFLVWSPEKGD